ncbi:MAG: ADP-glyceromanno-heptose 6-epimerase [Verrucomicrobiota bacterium]|nr:ADP-glyceromanno-heptose 6-epimerase [Verrucomicrobiota bacterium]
MSSFNRIVITGAAGFIGSALAHALAQENVELILVDHPLVASKCPNFVGLKEFAYLGHDHFLQKFKSGEIKADAVFHLGACSSTTESDWNYLLKNNVVYSQELWNVCAENGLYYAYASSAATYGDGSLGFDDRTPIEQLKPLNLYGKSKQDFDIWVLDQVQKGAKTPAGWAGLKFFNVYGPREGHKGRMASVVWQSYHQIKQHGQVKLFKSHRPEYQHGGQLRDFVYVGDVVAQMRWLWKHPEVRGIFNAGTSQARSFKDLALGTFSALGHPPNIEYIDMPLDIRDKYQYYTQATMAKIRDAGYNQPSTSLEAGITDYISWLKAQGF